MSAGRFFLDTNVLVYGFDASAPAKRRRSHELLESAVTQRTGVVSFQVVQEFLSVATRKFATPFRLEDALAYFDQVLVPLCAVFPSAELYRSALVLQSRLRFSFYDALIVAAALDAGCEVLYSEDLQHGQKIDGLTIKNPFTG
jgi:predicted nucleic acid-binding protein